MKIKNKIFLIILVLFFAGNVFAQSGGNSGLTFLKFGFGARNIAMGDAGTVFASDVTTLYYNPARLAGSEGSEVMFMHNNWIQDVRSEMIGAKTTLFGLPVAVGFNVTSIDNIEVRTSAGEPDSKFNATYFSGSLSTGFKIINELAAGISLKYLYENIFVDEANGLGVDLGLFYNTAITGLNISATVRNLGSMNALRNVETKLPTEIRVGTSYNFELSDSKLDFTGGVEYLNYTRDSENHLNLGGEARYNKVFAIRAGYQTGFDSKGFTAGVGFTWANLLLDYAYIPFKLGLGTANMFSIQFRF